MYIIKRERQKKDLIKNFEKEVDYTLKNIASPVGEVINSKLIKVVSNKENIMLTIDCFKTMYIMFRNGTCLQVNRYYLDIENVFKNYIIIK